MSLTKKQSSVLEFIRTYIETNKISPTQNEIQKHFGFKSLGSPQDYVTYLAKKGYIKVKKNATRGISLCGTCPACNQEVKEVSA